MDDNIGDKNHCIPNQTLKGFDKIDFIEELVQWYFHVLILFLLPLEMALFWSVLNPEFLNVLSFKIFLLILGSLSPKGFGNSLRFMI